MGRPVPPGVHPDFGGEEYTEEFHRRRGVDINTDDHRAEVGDKVSQMITD